MSEERKTELPHCGSDEEDEPLAEKGAIDCDVDAAACDYVPGHREGSATESEMSLREEIAETFRPRTEVLVASPLDGMPIPRDETTSLAIAHPFTIDTVVCVEDERKWVEVFVEELEQRHSEGECDGLAWRRTADGPRTWLMYGRDIALDVRSQFAEDGKEVVRRSYDPSAVSKRWGKDFVALRGGLVPVRPVRERCKHFLRQVMANDDVPNADERGHRLRFYNCAARKSVGGALMTLRDEAVYACDYRSPPDPTTTEKHLDAYDRERLASDRHLERVRLFNLG